MDRPRKRVILIEDNLEAQQFIKDNAPPDWEILTAVDGLSGLDLVRARLPILDLVIVDMGLPHLEGELVCTQIRRLSATLPILPYTGTAEPPPVLRELACLPPVIKPTSVAAIRSALQAACEHTPPPIEDSGALRFMMEQSARAERERRTRINVRQIVIVSTESRFRTWLTEVLRPVAHLMQADSPPTLRKIVETLNVAAVVGEAERYGIIAQVTKPRGIPLILIAKHLREARALAQAEVHDVFVETDTTLDTRLRATIDRLLNGGDDDGWAIEEIADPSTGSVIPADALRRLGRTPLTERQLEVLWLKYQNLTRPQIAQRLAISADTVSSHWDDAQKKLGLRDEAALEWVRRRLERRAGAEG